MHDQWSFLLLDIEGNGRRALVETKVNAVFFLGRRLALALQIARRDACLLALLDSWVDHIVFFFHRGDWVRCAVTTFTITASSAAITTGCATVTPSGVSSITAAITACCRGVIDSAILICLVCLCSSRRSGSTGGSSRRRGSSS